MSGDPEERALGAGSTITVDDAEYTLRPVCVQHLCDLERESLKFYKRQFLQTFAENADLLENGQELLEKKMAEAASWSLDDLPKKTAYDVSKVPITDELKTWVLEYQKQFGDEAEEELTDGRVRALVVTALDREELKPEQVKMLSGKAPRQGKIRYDQWWITGSMEGMVSFLFSSIRLEHPEVTKDKIRRWRPGVIFEGARKAEEITAPNLKNG